MNACFNERNTQLLYMISFKYALFYVFLCRKGITESRLNAKLLSYSCVFTALC